MRVFYTDMVADLFHYGHLNFIKQISDLKDSDDKLIVGVHNDETVSTYKRRPVMTMGERIDILSCCKYIDKIIPDAPLHITMEYVKQHEIDLIFIPSNRTDAEIKLMVETPYELGLVKKVPYTTTISTSEIINRIKTRNDL